MLLSAGSGTLSESRVNESRVNESARCCCIKASFHMRCCDELSFLVCAIRLVKPANRHNTQSIKRFIIIISTRWHKMPMNYPRQRIVVYVQK